MKDIVIFAGSIGNTYSIIKSVTKRINTRILIVFVNEKYASFFRYNRFVYDTEDWEIDSIETFRKKMELWYDKYLFVEKPIVYCTSDETCILISKMREWFEDRFVLTLPSNFIISTFNNKSTSIVEAGKHNIRLPLSKDIHNVGDIVSVEKFNFPVILKPLDYRSLGMIGFKVLVCYDYLSFKSQSLSILEKGISFQCQEYIEGGDEKSWFYIFYRSKNGTIIDCIGKKTVQYPVGQGIMAVGTSCDNETIKNISRTFLNQIDYIGIGGIEYKQNKSDYYFIEMSTRSEGFIRISDIAGIPIPLISYCDICNLPYYTSVLKQQEGKLYVDIIIYLIHILKNSEWGKILKIPTLLFSRKTIINVYPFAYYWFIFKQAIRKLLKM